MLSFTNINQSAPNLVKIYMILDEFDYESDWTQAPRVICPSIRFGVFDFYYTLASGFMMQT